METNLLRIWVGRQKWLFRCLDNDDQLFPKGSKVFFLSEFFVQCWPAYGKVDEVQMEMVMIALAMKMMAMVFYLLKTEELLQFLG